ncbi:MAG: Abi family protein [Acetobacter sp.]|nr:Abi family protein [Bacteroides sp.]MCM1341667.1 Abi family protein [Acetobacter sp.]MCM1434284.1 Abi family protein [Clostridiales bacterium]
MAKEFKTIDEQLHILGNRGLNIFDKEKAKDFLLHNNYYRVSGFSLTLRDHDKFFENAQFQNIIDIYNFDYELRHILLKYIEKIEVSFKSIYSYLFAQKYGPLGYKNSINFTDSDEFLVIINKSEEQLKKRLSHEAYLKHFIEDLHEEIPLWAYIELFTISDISKLYKISHLQLKIDIANNFGLSVNGGYEILEKYMHGMTIIRNLCAHNSRLYNRLFITKPSLNSKERKLLNLDSNGNKDNAHLFGYIINMRRLLKREDFINLKLEITELTHKYSFVDLKYYGFNPNWNNIL